MVESDTLSAVLNACFLELLKVFAVLLAAHERQAEANTKSCRPQSTTLPRSQQIFPICCLCTLGRLPLSALHPLAGDKDFLCQYYPECT